MNELALFAGIGGGMLGTHLLGWHPVCAVEKEPYCREVLLRRQRDGVLPLFPIWDDVRTFDGRPWRGIVDVVTAGFPCQPFSEAGRNLGASDDRNLWPDTIRIIREVGPQWALLENVPGLIQHDYFGEIIGDLADVGFDAEWETVSAKSVGAPHERERIWIVAHSTKEGLPHVGWCGENTEGPRRYVPTRSGRELDDTDGRGHEARRLHIRQPRQEQAACFTSWPGEIVRGEDGTARKIAPGIPLVADGVPCGMERLASTGNAQVPAVVRAAWHLLSGAMK